MRRRHWPPKVAYFQDAPHPAFGIVPGDGLHILLAGSHRRDSAPLLPAQRPKAKRARSEGYGAVNEVVSREALLPRAWELARQLKKQNPLTLR